MRLDTSAKQKPPYPVDNSARFKVILQEGCV